MRQNQNKTAVLLKINQAAMLRKPNSVLVFEEILGILMQLHLTTVF